MPKLTLNEKTFHPDPNIGHCITLQGMGIDLLGIEEDAQLEKLVSNPIAFLSILEVLLKDEAAGDAAFAMPQLASHMKDGKSPEARIAVLSGFHDFFRDNGYPQLAAAMNRMQEAADMVTAKVAESLESGELRQKLDAIANEAIKELTTSD